LASLAKVTLQSRKPEKSVRGSSSAGISQNGDSAKFLPERRVAYIGDRVSEFVRPLSHHIFAVVGAFAVD
jgi:hypothetical protein